MVQAGETSKMHSQVYIQAIVKQVHTPSSPLSPLSPFPPPPPCPFFPPPLPPSVNVCFQRGGIVSQSHTRLIVGGKSCFCGRGVPCHYIRQSGLLRTWDIQMQFNQLHSQPSSYHQCIQSSLNTVLAVAQVSAQQIAQPSLVPINYYSLNLTPTCTQHTQSGVTKSR